jgi:transposase-like protein
MRGAVAKPLDHAVPRHSRLEDSSHMEVVLRFAWWSRQLHRFPNVQQICDHFGVNRATAYRWRHALAASIGIATPPNTSHDHDEDPANTATDTTRRDRRIRRVE